MSAQLDTESYCDKAAPRHVPVQTYFDRLHAVLGLYLTNKCNIKCRHCAVSSSPSESTRLLIDEVLEKLPSAVASGIVKALHINGGEPFLYQSDLRRLAAEGQRLGIGVGINTNAFWAKSVDRGRRMLDSIPGITQLMLSTDVYHEEFLPLEYVKNAVIAGLEKEIIVQIAVCTPGGRKDSFVDKLLSVLGDKLASIIPMGINPVEAGGRADELPEAQWRRQQRFLPKGRCSQINRPVVLENGTVFACCNSCVTTACAGSPLNLGELRSTSLQEIHNRADKDYIIQAIRALGPKFLGEILIDEGLGPLLAMSYFENDICSLCSDIMSKPILVEALVQATRREEIRRRIAIARAATFDELGMLFQASATGA